MKQKLVLLSVLVFVAMIAVSAVSAGYPANVVYFEPEDSSIKELDFTNWDYLSSSDEKIPVNTQNSPIEVISIKENKIGTGGGSGLGLEIKSSKVLSGFALSPSGGGLGAVKGIAIKSIYLYDAKTCKDVQASSPYDPIGVTTVFSPTDSISYTWLHFKDIWSSHTVKWKWYDPDGNFYTDCTYTIPNPSDYGYDYWEWYKCWCGIYIKGYSAAEKEGIWTVKVYLDGNHIETLNFNIEYIISDHTMCKNVQESSPYEPIDRTSTFLSDDEKAVSWLRLDNVTNSLNVEWKWYDPSGRLYTTGEYTIPNPSDDYWDWYKCWCWIYIKDHTAAEKPGKWKVEVYIDDEYKFDEDFTIVQPPVASFTYSPQHPEVNENITFNASLSYDPDGTIVNYEWDFGDGNITSTTEEIINHSYSEAGIYEVTLTVTDNDGAKNSTTKMITVMPAKPSVSISTDKYEYTAGDVMLINITITNPTSEWKGVKFLFCLDITDYDKHFTIINNRSLMLPPLYDKTFTLRWKLPELKSSFNASWHVAVFNKTTSELISEDYADWKYVAAKEKKMTPKDVKELKKSVREIEIPF